MTSIEIIFNGGSFNKPYQEESIKLISSFIYDKEIRIESSVENVTFNNRFELIDFFEKIRGVDNNNLKIRFYEKNLIGWANANFYEQQTFKSLVLIYHWLELSLSNPKDLDVKNNLYNEFVADWNFRPGTQNTIFLLPEKIVTKSDSILLLENLMKINLLCKITVSNGSAAYTNYFIPLLTPGVPQDYYNEVFQRDGIKTYNLWKELLELRDGKIKNWISNRF